jgi:DNA (cytosine-5)-methyltransferase 1
MRPILVDTFCAGGGASVGYARAGFEVIGVDKEPQPRYPLEFIRADALEFLAQLAAAGNRLPDGRPVVALAASPPCFRDSVLHNLHKVQERGHVSMIPQTRAALVATGLPYVIENVPGADMIDPLTLCGSMFGLGADCADHVWRYLKRHRQFESNRFLTVPGPCKHDGQAIGVHGGGRKREPRQARAIEGRGGYTGDVREKRDALGIDWLPRHSLNLAIPPAYTEYLGRQLLAQL